MYICCVLVLFPVCKIYKLVVLGSCDLVFVAYVTSEGAGCGPADIVKFVYFFSFLLFGTTCTHVALTTCPSRELTTSS